MNLKNERILKLLNKGMTPEQIAKKLGLANTERVQQGTAGQVIATWDTLALRLAAIRKAVQDYEYRKQNRLATKELDMAYQLSQFEHEFKALVTLHKRSREKDAAEIARLRAELAEKQDGVRIVTA